MKKNGMKILAITLLLLTILTVVLTIVIVAKLTHSASAKEDTSFAESFSGTLCNAYLYEDKEKQLIVLYEGKYYVADKSAKSDYTGVADVEITDGKITKIYAKAESIENGLKEKKDEILREVEKKSKNYFSNIHIPSFPVLDFKSMINKAQKSESNKKDNWQAEKGFGNFLKRTFSKIAGIFSDKYEHYGMTNYRTPDIEKVSRECIDEIINAINAYVDSTKKAIKNFMVALATLFLFVFLI